MKANDELRQYTCTDNYYRHPFGMLFTDGIRALCDKFECYWLLDVVCSYQPELRSEEFQVWTLTISENNSGVVLATNGKGLELKRQNIVFTDFRAECVEVWIDGEVVLLPSER